MHSYLTNENNHWQVTNYFITEFNFYSHNGAFTMSLESMVSSSHVRKQLNSKLPILLPHGFFFHIYYYYYCKIIS